MAKIFRYSMPIVMALGLTTTGHFAYQGYVESKKPSQYELAASNLGFQSTHQQEAFLNIMQMAGYLKPQEIWQAVNKIGFKDPDLIFSQLYGAIHNSKADQDDHSKFDAKKLRKNFGKNSDLAQTDVEDLLLYLAQNAFGRELGRERNELVSQEWMFKNEKEFFASARVLGLIDRIEPQHKEYELGWILGASRIGMLARIIECNYLFHKYSIKTGDISVLAGARELWAEIDGIIPKVRERLDEAYKAKANLDEIDISLPVGQNTARIEEGKEYMAGLAARLDIKLDPDKPFISCAKGPARRTCANSVNPEDKLTETKMSMDLLNSYPIDVHKVNMVDTASDSNGERPNTATTARDAAKAFVDDIKTGKYGDPTKLNELDILAVTNQPYIERQTRAVQREIDGVLKEQGLNSVKVKVDGVGFKCKQDVPTVHSELAALVAEMFKDANSVGKHDTKTLLYQTRNHDKVEDQLPVVHVDEPHILQDWFDTHLE